MSPRRASSPRLDPRMIAIIGSTIPILSTGCVKPDESRPWSTRDQSVSTARAEPTTPPRVIERTMTAETAVREPAPSTGIATETPTEDPIATEPPVTIAPPTLAGDTPSDRAGSWLRQAIHDEYPLVRAYAFEAMEHDPSMLLEFGGNGLVDENRGVRFVTTMAIGRTCLADLTPLVEPGLLDASRSVQAASIFALRELGQPVDPSPLADMTMGEDPEVRGNAYMVLGMLQNASAIPVIDASLGKGMRLRNPMRIRITELQAAEALVMLGDVDDVEPIRAALFSPVEQGELTVLACDMLGRLQDERARPMLMRLILADGNERRPPEIRVAAAHAILRMPPPWENGLEQVILEYAKAEDPLLRTQVAAALADAASPAAAKALNRLLEDQNSIVRTAAAGAILERSAADTEPPGAPFEGARATVPD